MKQDKNFNIAKSFIIKLCSTYCRFLIKYILQVIKVSKKVKHFITILRSNFAMNRTEKIKKRKRKKLRKSIIFFLLFLLLVVGGSVIYFTVQTINAANKAYNDLGREKSNLREETVSVKKILFLFY